jgi:hypothetical protein
VPDNNTIRHTDPPVNKVRVIIFVILLQVIFHVALAQKKYYEFNNPDALKLNKKRIETLVANDWQGIDMQVQVRGDNYPYRNRRTVTYHSDGTYTSNGLTGKWKIKYNRYLIHEPTAKNTGEKQALAGIYGITSLSDSILILSKLHSSTGDMKTKLSFGKKVERDIVLSNIVTSKRVKVFTDEEPINFFVHAKRYTLPVDKIALVDSLALAFIKHQATNQSTPINSLEPFFRQYVGFDDDHGNKVIYLNAFCEHQAEWENSIIHNEPGSQCGFRIYVNITKNECFGFHSR